MRWLLDVLAILALAWWQRTRVSPVLRLVLGSGRPIGSRRARRPTEDVIAVLVSCADMEANVRRALSGRAILRFTTTWAELEQVIANSAPLAVFADPLADETGDAVGHLTRVCDEGRVPVILYTSLTPACPPKLLALSHHGICHVLFHRLDDGADRMNAVVDSVGWERPRDPPGHHPPLHAA